MNNGKMRAEWFWVDRWMTSSAWGLPLEPRGLYREMLSQAWIRGGKLPNNPPLVQRLCGVTPEEWDRCWETFVKPYWIEDGKWLYNETQREIMGESLDRREQAVALGKLRAESAQRGPDGRFITGDPSSGGSSGGVDLRSTAGPACSQPPDLDLDLDQEKDQSVSDTRTKPKRTPQEQLARDLALALGSNLNPCRKQIQTLRAKGMPIETLSAYVTELGQPGLAPWDWTRKVMAESTKEPDPFDEIERKHREQQGA